MSEQETFDVIEWRRVGAMNADKRDVPRTSLGRKVRITANRQPLKGELYLKPSGKRGVFNVLVAQNDHAKRYYLIIERRN